MGPKPLSATRAEVACYAADMLASLRRLSEASGMVLLAHLVDLACAEAQRNAHVAKAENELSGATPIKRPPESVPN